MARRALDFAKAQQVTDPGYALVVARLQTSVAEADKLAMQQGEGTIGEQSSVERRRGLKNEIKDFHLDRLRGIARLAEKSHPELAKQFPIPAKSTAHRTFLLAAQSLMAAALPHKELFISLGLGENFFDELGRALAEFDAVTSSAHTGRSGHVVAGKSLKLITGECRADIDLLNTYLRAAFSKEPEVLAGWKSAKNLAGPFHHQAPAPETPAPPADPAQH